MPQPVVVQPVLAGSALRLAYQEPRIFKHLQMLRDSRLSERQSIDDITAAGTVLRSQAS
ncbi:6,7-dimethyl-8-ribityllumazine synthase [Roseibium sp. TrichSKD4]|nr:6,7-dimethyl-8-ribityllumazine synthase [Roseibium sp. TrichSKD4]